MTAPPPQHPLPRLPLPRHPLPRHPLPRQCPNTLHGISTDCPPTAYLSGKLFLFRILTRVCRNGPTTSFSQRNPWSAYLHDRTAVRSVAGTLQVPCQECCRYWRTESFTQRFPGCIIRRLSACTRLSIEKVTELDERVTRGKDCTRFGPRSTT